MPQRFASSLVVLLLAAGASAYARTGAVDARLDEALAEVSYFSFDRAVTLFRAVMSEAKVGGRAWQRAVYGTAVCTQQLSPPTEALSKEAQRLYRLLLDTTPDSRYAPRATLNLGRIAELSDFGGDQVDLAGARRLYQQVIDRWPNLPIAGEASMRVAATHIQTYETKAVRHGIAVLRKWLTDHPKDALASAMWQYLGDTHFYPLEEYRAAVDCYQKADAIGLLEKGREGPVYWRVAVLADRFLKDRELAVRYYTKIIKLVPTSGKAYEAQLALKRLGAPVPRIILFDSSDSADSDGGAPASQPSGRRATP